MPKNKHTIEQRISRLTDRSGGPDACWFWLGSKLPQGYGQIKIKGHTILAHRAAFDLVYGEIPDNTYVCHRCDVPSCVNPSHLFLGSSADNNKDRDQKGRTAAGEKHGNSVLNESTVREIRDALASGDTKSSIARRFSVCEGTVRHISTGLRWRGVGA